MMEFTTKETINIAESVAKEQAIKFAKWLSAEGWQQYDTEDRWICQSQSNRVYTTKQLYEMFEKEK